MSVLLWTIWIIRNDLVFNNRRANLNQLEFLIKHRAYMWSKASDLVSSNQEAIWNIWPHQSFKMHRLSRINNLIKYWSSISDLLGFIDGAYKLLNNNNSSSGIGGFLMNKSSKVIFLFANPTQCSNAQDAEFQALVFLLKAVQSSSYSHKTLTIFSDSTNLIKLVMDFKKGSAINMDLDQVSEVMDHTHIVHISRDLNKEADQLAKQGLNRPSPVSGWFQR